MRFTHIPTSELFQCTPIFSQEDSLLEDSDMGKMIKFQKISRNEKKKLYQRKFGYN